MQTHDDVTEDVRVAGDAREYVVRSPLFDAVRERWERELAAALARGATIVSHQCCWYGSAETAIAVIVTRDEPPRQLSAVATPHPRLSPPRRGHLRPLPPVDREAPPDPP